MMTLQPSAVPVEYRTIRAVDVATWRNIVELSEAIEREFRGEKLDDLLQASLKMGEATLARLEALIAEHAAIEADLGDHSESDLLRMTIAGWQLRLMGSRVALLRYYTRVAAAEAATVQRSFYWSIAILLFLTIVAVGLPLSQLSAFSVEHKAVFLGAGAIGIGAFLLFLVWQIRELRALSRAHVRDLDRPDFIPP